MIGSFTRIMCCLYSELKVGLKVVDEQGNKLASSKVRGYWYLNSVHTPLHLCITTFDRLQQSRQ